MTKSTMSLSIIMIEGPISRAYLRLLQEHELKEIKIYYLKNKNFFMTRSRIFNFFFKNQIPLRLIKDKKNQNLINQIELYFKVKNNFIKEMYDPNLIDYFKNIINIDTENINSESVMKIISEDQSNLILNTSSQIYKNILRLNKNFISIHSAYLPDVRGADGVLNSLKYFNEIGHSAFFISKNIDEGPIIYRSKLDLPRLKGLDLENNNNQTIHNILFSLFDPLLRAKCLENLIKHGVGELMKQSKNDGKYFNYIDKNQIKEILKKIC